MTRIIGEYVQHQVYDATGTNTHGNPVKAWGTPSQVGVYAFDPGSSSEPREPGGDRVIVEPTLYAPSTAVFDANDRVTARGLLYEVEGDTRQWIHPDGSQKGNVITLRRVEG